MNPGKNTDIVKILPTSATRVLLHTSKHISLFKIEALHSPNIYVEEDEGKVDLRGHTGFVYGNKNPSALLPDISSI